MSHYDDYAAGKHYGSPASSAGIVFNKTPMSIPVSEEALDNTASVQKMIADGITCAVGYEAFGTSQWIHFISFEPIEEVKEYWKNTNYGYTLIEPIETWLAWSKKISHK